MKFLRCLEQTLSIRKGKRKANAASCLLESFWRAVMRMSKFGEVYFKKRINQFLKEAHKET